MPGDFGLPHPVVSAVGHEPDNPLSDLVADLRAATPTDAAKKLVPDAAAEQALILDLRRRSAQALRNWVQREQRGLDQVRSRPVLADPLRMVSVRQDEIDGARNALRRDVRRLVDMESQRVEHLTARLTTLGPAATLARGYWWCSACATMAPWRCCGPLPTHLSAHRCE